MSPIFGSKCPQCGHSVPREAKFCPYCRTALNTTQCSTCGAAVPAGANFCPQCQAQLVPSPRPVYGTNQWRKSPQDFATRIEVEDVRGFFRKDLVVEPGTNVIWLSDGRSLGVSGPGRYTLETLSDKILHLGQLPRVTAILVDVGDVELDFTVNDLYTNDPLKIALDSRVVVRLIKPLIFVTNLMKGQANYTLNELRRYLYQEVREAAQNSLSGVSVYDLDGDPALGARIQQDIEMRLNDSVERNGLAFDRVRTLDFRYTEWDEVRDSNVQYFVQITRRQADVEGKRRLLDIKTQEDLLEVAESTQRVQKYEQRAEIWRRYREAVLENRKDQALNEEELAAFMDQIDEKKLIRDQEREALIRRYAQEKEDAQRARAHLLAQLDIEQEQELRMARLAADREADMAELESEMARHRQQLEGEIDVRRLQWEAYLSEQRARWDWEREQRRVDELDRRENALADARQDAEIRGLQREQQRLDAELAMTTKEKAQAIQRRDEAERTRMALERQGEELRLQLERRRAEQELDLARRQQESEMSLAQQKQAQEYEIKRLETLGMMGSEALVAASNAEQAQIVAELERTRALEGKSAEEILAMAAERSPEVAAAFAEKFRAVAEAGGAQKSEIERLYQDMLARQEQNSGEMRRIQAEQTRQVKEMFDKALDSQRELAVAFAQHQGQGSNVVIVPSDGNTPAQPAAGSGARSSMPAAQEQSVICQKCHLPSPAGTRFCANCGEPFYP